MKKIIYVALITLTACSFYSCFEDKGNYDYTPISDVAIEFDKATYEVIALEEGLIIAPDVKTSTPDANLTFTWTMSKSYTESNVEYHGEIKIDTIGRQKDLRIDMVEYDPGSYYLYYRVDNKATGVTYNTRVMLNVSTKYGNAFYVMKDMGGTTDLDVYSRISDPEYNIITEYYGAPISGAPTNLGLSFAYCFRDANHEYKVARALNVAAGNEMRIYNSNDLSLIYDHSTMFWTPEPVEKPLNMCNNTYCVNYLSSKGYYTSYQTANENILGAGRFSSTEFVLNSANFSVSPNEKYMINMCTGAGTHWQTKEPQYTSTYFFYDELNGRFLYGDFNGSLYEFAPDHGAIADRFLYMGGNRISGTHSVFAVFEDAGDPSKRKLYHLDIDNEKIRIYEVNVPQDDKDPGRKIDSDLKFHSATHYATHETLAQSVFFVYDNQIYRFDLATKTEMELPISDIGAGEEITYISHKWWTGAGIKEPAESEDRLFDYLVVATHKAGNYKVYLYNINGAITPSGAAERILEGPGKAVQLQYASDKMWNESFNDYAWGI